MRGAARLPILISIGLAMGLVIGLALAHFFWIAATVIIAYAIVDFVRRHR